jgi:DNA-binding winged helix-turn-helix (wHTH) protein/tetratricopeptide (TPR) repeat protein
MAKAVRFRFGECVIDLDTRTLLRAGSVQATEPKVFDAIVLLISQRGRVVPKKELLTAVWGSQVVVTEGVIARTIMKARRLIGDDADNPSMIKTVHRVGYRFVGLVSEEAGAAAHARHEAAERPMLHETGCRVAVLPFRNATGRPDLAWIDLGLMSMTIADLQSRPGLAVVPVTDLLAVGVKAEDREHVDAVIQKFCVAVGASDGVHATVETDPGGEFALVFEGFGPRLGALKGRAVGFDLVAVCRKMGDKLVELAVGDANDPDREPSPRQESAHQQFVHEAHSRALHALQLEKWELARKLLVVALDIVPDDLTLELDFARCLVSERDARAGPLLEELLVQARGAGVLETSVLQLLAIHLHGRGQAAKAEALFTEALKLAEERQDQETELQLLTSFAAALVNDGRPAVAIWFVERAAVLAQKFGNRVAQARLLDVRGRIASLEGNDRVALAAFSEGAALGEEFGVDATASFNLIHAGVCMVNAGKMLDAAQAFRRSLDLAMQSGGSMCLGMAACYAVRFGGRRAEDQVVAREVVRRVRGASTSGNPLLQAAAEIAEAFVLARESRLAESCALFEHAHGCALQVGSRSFALHSTTHWARCLVCLGRLEEAEALCATLQQSGAGRLKRLASGSALHCRSMIAYMQGSIDEALALVDHSLSLLPPAIGRIEAGLDAAWMSLQSSDIAGALRRVDAQGSFMAEALASGYGAAMLTRARLDLAVGKDADARSLVDSLAGTSTDFRSGKDTLQQLLRVVSGQPAHAFAATLPSLYELTRTLEFPSADS